MPENALEVDEKGLVVIRPILGWVVAPITAENAVILRLQYAETPAEVGTGGRALQVALTAPQALELAELLAKHGRIAGRVPPGPQH